MALAHRSVPFISQFGSPSFGGQWPRCVWILPAIDYRCQKSLRSLNAFNQKHFHWLLIARNIYNKTTAIFIS